MSTNTNEAALEACIERHLSGGVSVMPSEGGSLGDDVGVYQTTKGAGYLRGKSTDFKPEFAIDEAKFWQFLEATQAKELAKLHYKPDWKRQILERLHRKLKKDGILAVLKKGLDVDNCHFDLFYRLPYKSYYEVQKSIEDNPEFDTVKAQKKLRAYVESHQQTIATKAALMADHFLQQVVATKKLRGQARGMVVTRNIESAIRYYFAIQKEIKAANAPFQAIVAFSGKKMVDGIEHTEESLNGFSSKDIPDKLAGDIKPGETNYRLLVVANKFLTGFDEPLLHSMYVDKRLQSVLAVQALSRLNRCNAKMQKQDIFILDFYNTAAEIKEAFDPFYTATSLTEPTDVNVLHDLKDALDDAELYSVEDIEKFNELFFKGVDAEQLHPIIDATVIRFDMIEEEDDKIDFKIKAKQFVKLYGQLACIMPFSKPEWEKLHWFLKFLIPKLKVAEKDKDELDALLESVDLSTYGLERVRLNQHIELDSEESELEPENPNVRGVHGGEEDESPLDEIIRHFNERFFDAWDATPEEQRVKLINIMENVQKSAAYQAQVVDNPDEQNRRIALESLISQAVNKERKKDLDLYKIYAGDPDFKKAFEESIIRILALHEKSKPA